MDVPNIRTACEKAERIGGLVGGFKMGFELILASIADLVEPEGPREAEFNLIWLRRFFDAVKGRLFLDVKLKDIKNTVEGAARQIARLNPKSFNLHADGSFQMVEGAAATIRQAGVDSKIWTVTLLTDMTYDDLADLEILPPMAEQDHAKDTLLARVLVRTDRAKRAGLDGVIASAQEAKAIREHCGCGFDIVTPAIRPMWAAVNDQKRPTTPADAISAGADYLVIGRPILKPPAEIGAPENAIDLICEEIESVRV